MDTLIVRGLRGMNGDYPVDLLALTDVGAGGESLTNREQHRLRTIADVRGADIRDAFVALDAATLVGLAAIILARHGKTVADSVLWDARFLYANAERVPEDDQAGPTIIFAFHDRNLIEQQEVEESPPVEAPSSPQPSGGEQSNGTSESSENVQSLTGRLASARSAGSDRVTSAS